MIFDNIKNRKMYSGINPKFEKAFEFIKKAIEENFEAGNYEIDGKGIYAFIQSYDSKLKDECSFEGHRKYIDIQYIMDGCEVMGLLEISDVVPKEEYNDEKDGEKIGFTQHKIAKQNLFLTVKVKQKSQKMANLLLYMAIILSMSSTFTTDI